jgi:hypothetical protein
MALGQVVFENLYTHRNVNRIVFHDCFYMSASSEPA